jgi:catechol 2,3-dioxygenase-like lactoylglutathione lyase family enzyme
MRIDRIDHIVLTVRDIAATIDFYTRVLGMEAAAFGEGRYALQFGTQKINLHQVGQEVEPTAAHPTPGGVDLCLITESSLALFQAHLAAENIEIVEGPVQRTGATGPLTSIYVRDPDGNLIEIATYAVV